MIQVLTLLWEEMTMNLLEKLITIDGRKIKIIDEEIKKAEVVILKKQKIWKLPDNIRSTVLMCD